MSDEELLDAQDEGVWYRWLCPHCDSICESEEDTRGSVVECDVCRKRSRHQG